VVLQNNRHPEFQDNTYCARNFIFMHKPSGSGDNTIVVVGVVTAERRRGRWNSPTPSASISASNSQSSPSRKEIGKSGIYPSGLINFLTYLLHGAESFLRS